MKSLVLSYGSTRRRHPLRKATCVLAVLGLVVICVRYGRVCKSRIDLLLAQQKCLAFDNPPSTIAFGPYPNPAMPRPLVDFATLTGLLRGYHDARCTNPPLIVFAHRLLNKKGERLVIISAWDVPNEGGVMIGGISFHAEVFSLATLFRQPLALTNSELDPTEPMILQPVHLGREPCVTIDFGHPDAIDLAMFEMNYHVGNFTGTVRGKLLDNDTIELLDLSKNGLWDQVRPRYWPLANTQ
jgi:hypothetical protein